MPARRSRLDVQREMANWGVRVRADLAVTNPGADEASSPGAGEVHSPGGDGGRAP